MQSFLKSFNRFIWGTDQNPWMNHCFESDLFDESVNKLFILIRFLSSTQWFDRITIRRFSVNINLNFSLFLIVWLPYQSVVSLTAHSPVCLSLQGSPLVSTVICLSLCCWFRQLVLHHRLCFLRCVWISAVLPVEDMQLLWSCSQTDVELGDFSLGAPAAHAVLTKQEK